MRIVVAKPGLDGHDRGAKVIARALRDGGHEVIYTGLRRTPQEIVRIVTDEDAAAVGLSTLSGAHNVLIPKVCDGLREAGLGDVVVFPVELFLNTTVLPYTSRVLELFLAQVQQQRVF